MTFILFVVKLACHSELLSGHSDAVSVNMTEAVPVSIACFSRCFLVRLFISLLFLPGTDVFSAASARPHRRQLEEVIVTRSR